MIDLVGNTPLLRLASVDADFPKVEIWAKCEFSNPGGSVKDRAALAMLQAALRSGQLQPGMRLLDSTSGNTGIAYAMIGASLGVPVTLVMPENASEPRKQVIRSYGAELIFSDPMLGSDGAIHAAHALMKSHPERYFYPNQYANPENPGAHSRGTAEEIWAQTGGRVTHFVAGVGTSGTIIGSSRRLHELSEQARACHDGASGRRVHCVAVQPDDAMHGLEGLKHLPTSLVPEIYDASVIDETIWLATEDGWDRAEQVTKDEGLCIGYSSGGNIAAARQLAQRAHAEGERAVVVTMLCDRGDRYFVPLQWECNYRW